MEGLEKSITKPFLYNLEYISRLQFKGSISFKKCKIILKFFLPVCAIIDSVRNLCAVTTYHYRLTFEIIAFKPHRG